MINVKSKSKKVQALFKCDMDTRLSLFSLKPDIYSNDELVEIEHIGSTTIESHPERKYFYQELITSQYGPFNQDVFTLYQSILNEGDSLLHLIKYAANITDEDKCEWFKYAIVSSPAYFTKAFVIGGECTDYGINLDKPPFAYKIVGALTLPKYSITVLTNRYKSFMWAHMDKFSPTELLSWCREFIILHEQAFMFLSRYPNSPPELLEELFDSCGPSEKDELLTHKNVTGAMQISLFEITDDASYLPDGATDTFIF